MFKLLATTWLFLRATTQPPQSLSLHHATRTAYKPCGRITNLVIKSDFNLSIKRKINQLTPKLQKGTIFENLYLFQKPDLFQ